MARKRVFWRRHQGKIDPRRLVFIDETWTKTNMTPIRGWAPKGQRLIAKIPHGHWKTLTFIAGLRCDGIHAPCVLDQPINKVSFLSWIKQYLAPTLRPGDIVVMDNLASHKNLEVRQAIRDAGARRLFLPPYSPDLNPIEQMFSKLKTLIRKAQARTVEGAWKSIGEILNEFKPDECANYLVNSGYAST